MPGTKAQQLLRAHLDPDQRVDWDTTGTFRLTGSRGGKFRLHGCYPIGTRRFFFWRWEESWCICLNSADECYRYPLEDRVLAIKLLIETDEWKFRRIGNPRKYAPWWVLYGLLMLTVIIIGAIIMAVRS